MRTISLGFCGLAVWACWGLLGGAPAVVLAWLLCACILFSYLIRLRPLVGSILAASFGLWLVWFVDPVINDHHLGEYVGYDTRDDWSKYLTPPPDQDAPFDPCAFIRKHNIKSDECK
jgi:hypothetical protein